ncbi:DUF2267 domain-containing protein [Rhodohalobacter sp. 8-1]|uniref:DUF2267 domain-containing protein n=1 Tax=Rhodohalobacter sp. 8-1 TaxID=3131972 RepID=UPI0030EC37E9
MNNSPVDVEKYVHDVNEYINQLAVDLEHPEEQQRVLRIWRAVMHTIRDRITISESFDLMAALPLILRGIYTTGWKYTESPKYDYDTVEEMKDQVKSLQSQYGEQDFNWMKSTEEIISIVLDSLERYFTDGQMKHIRSQLPKDIKTLV